MYIINLKVPHFLFFILNLISGFVGRLGGFMGVTVPGDLWNHLLKGGFNIMYILHVAVSWMWISSTCEQKPLCKHTLHLSPGEKNEEQWTVLLSSLGWQLSYLRKDGASVMSRLKQAIDNFYHGSSYTYATHNLYCCNAAIFTHTWTSVALSVIACRPDWDVHTHRSKRKGWQQEVSSYLSLPLKVNHNCSPWSLLDPCLL